MKKSGSRARTNIVGMPDTSVSRKLLLVLVRVLEGCEKLLGTQFEDLLEEKSLRIPSLAEVMDKVLEDADERQLETAHYKAVNAPLAEILEALAHAMDENKALQGQLAQGLYVSTLIEEGGVEDRVRKVLRALYDDIEASADMLREQNVLIEVELGRQQARTDEAHELLENEGERYIAPLGATVSAVQEFVRGFQVPGVSISEQECVDAEEVLADARAKAEEYSSMRTRVANILMLLEAGESRLRLLLADGRTVQAELQGLFTSWKHRTRLLSDIGVDYVSLLGMEGDLTPFERRVAQFSNLQTASPRKVRLREASPVREQLIEVCAELEDALRDVRKRNRVPVLEKTPDTVPDADSEVDFCEPEERDFTDMEEYVLIGFHENVTALSRGRTALGVFQIFCIAEFLEESQERDFMRSFELLRRSGYLEVSRREVFFVPTARARAAAEKILPKWGPCFSEKIKIARRKKDSKLFDQRTRRT